MDRGFWDTLTKPIFALAPMANVTDAAFRRVIAKCGKPDIFWTEFVSVEGLLSRGREKLLVDFMYTEAERPIVAQIFGGKPEQFYEVANLCVKLGFDGIDINMGCPDKGVEKSGGGAALIKKPELAQQIIAETKRGIADAGSSIPVSVKTRLGYNKNEIETWIPALLEAEPAAITLHARTRKEMSFFPAKWSEVKRMVELVAAEIPDKSERPLLLGNGDVQDLAHGRKLIAETGCDGVMLGRAIFGNPWLFRELTEKPRPAKPLGEVWAPTVKEKLDVCVEHTKLFEELFGLGTPPLSSRATLALRSLSEVGTRDPSLAAPSVIPAQAGIQESQKRLDSRLPSFAESYERARHGNDKKRIKPFDVMKKHFKAYVNGFDGAKELRVRMMEAESAEQIEALVEDFLKSV